jgi:hypothetical protein
MYASVRGGKHREGRRKKKKKRERERERKTEENV